MSPSRVTPRGGSSGKEQPSCSSVQGGSQGSKAGAGLGAHVRMRARTHTLSHTHPIFLGDVLPNE